MNALQSPHTLIVAAFSQLRSPTIGSHQTQRSSSACTSTFSFESESVDRLAGLHVTLLRSLEREKPRSSPRTARDWSTTRARGRELPSAVIATLSLTPRIGTCFPRRPRLSCDSRRSKGTPCSLTAAMTVQQKRGCWASWGSAVGKGAASSLIHTCCTIAEPVDRACH